MVRNVWLEGSLSLLIITSIVVQVMVTLLWFIILAINRTSISTPETKTLL